MGGSNGQETSAGRSLPKLSLIDYAACVKIPIALHGCSKRSRSSLDGNSDSHHQTRRVHYQLPTVQLSLSGSKSYSWQPGHCISCKRLARDSDALIATASATVPVTVACGRSTLLAHRLAEIAAKPAVRAPAPRSITSPATAAHFSAVLQPCDVILCQVS